MGKAKRGKWYPESLP